jgi:teichuronic acid biosynthesis glycosyltransferase TuaG
MSKPVVSVVTPVYNAEDFLSETIESVLKQTFESFEHLLVDDCSTDSSANIVKEYAKKDSRVKYIKLPENSGAAVARNTGIEHAQGRYIAFIDSDDVWYPEKLTKQLQFMNDNNEAFTYTKYEHMTEDGEIQGSPEFPEKLSYSGLLKNTAIACSTVVIDRQVIGDFRMPLVRKGQDTATWLKILRNHDYAYLVDEVLNQYRGREGSLSSDRVSALKRTWNTYRNIEKLPLHKAVYYFGFYVFNAVKRRL